MRVDKWPIKGGNDYYYMIVCARNYILQYIETQTAVYYIPIGIINLCIKNMCIHYKQRQTERIANFFFFSQWEKFNKKNKKKQKRKAQLTKTSSQSTS